MVEFTPEKSKKIALARLDLLNQWKEFRKKSDNKLQADYDFVNLHNTSNSHLFEILGKISRGTLHRWKNTLNGTEDYTKLIPQYRYAKVDEYRTCLTDEEIKKMSQEIIKGMNKISQDMRPKLIGYCKSYLQWKNLHWRDLLDDGKINYKKCEGTEKI